VPAVIRPLGQDQGPPGPPGPTGATGATGTPGAAWLTGDGPPSDMVGVNGDLYLDVLTGDVYDKVGGTWF
jgi:hypothetical protein